MANVLMIFLFFYERGNSIRFCLFIRTTKIDSKIIPNIGKYTRKPFVDNGENAEFYEFEEGKTDLFGNLLAE